MSTLETPRLRLRMFRQADFDAYADMLADPEVSRYLAQGRPLSRPDAWRHMAMLLGHWQLFGFGPWAVEERASGEFLGRIGPYCPPGWPGLELIWTIRRQSWGQGYATEGARAALAYVFEHMGRDRIISLIRPQNAASLRVAEKIGQRLQDRIHFYGEEALVYGIRRAAWLESSRAREASGSTS
jgi:RimJ/RimL family protein N-acetyltransferase